MGTHVDAPLHFIDNEKPIGLLDLNIFIGACQVIKVNSSTSTPVLVEELSQYKELPPRVLICTTNENKYNEWTDNYRPLSIELIDFLYKKKVKLIGIDSPSVDSFYSKNAAVHKQIFSYGITILESLYLNHVPEGEYELIALPLKFMNLEASPVRAILRV